MNVDRLKTDSIMSPEVIRLEPAGDGKMKLIYDDESERVMVNSPINQLDHLKRDPSDRNDPVREVSVEPSRDPPPSA